MRLVKKLSKILLAFLSMTYAVCAIAQTIEAPAFVVGDAWEYKFTTKKNFMIGTVPPEPYTYTHKVYQVEPDYTLLEVNTTEEGKRLPKFGAVKTVASGDTIESYEFDETKANRRGKRFEWAAVRQNYHHVQFPLTVGKNYEIVRSYTESTEKQEAIVKPLAKIKTLAGEFDAHEIEINGYWTMKSGGASGRMVSSYWYAPAVKAVVLYQLKSHNPQGGLMIDRGYELTKWTPAKP